MVRDDRDAPLYISYQKAYAESLEYRATQQGTEPITNLECNSPEMAAALGRQVGEPVGHAGSPDGFAAWTLGSLAAADDMDVPGSRQAWDIYDGRSVQPQWASEITRRRNIIPFELSKSCGHLGIGAGG